MNDTGISAKDKVVTLAAATSNHNEIVTLVELAEHDPDILSAIIKNPALSEIHIKRLLEMPIVFKNRDALWSLYEGHSVAYNSPEMRQRFIALPAFHGLLKEKMGDDFSAEDFVRQETDVRIEPDVRELSPEKEKKPIKQRVKKGGRKGPSTPRRKGKQRKTGGKQRGKISKKNW